MNAAWLAFAGRALLTAEAGELHGMLEELREATPPGDPRGLLAERMETALAVRPELEQEYVRLFLDPQGAPCPPWQSAQGDEPRLLGPAHLSALAWYRRLGVEPQRANEPADHAGLLLTFAARLAETGGDLAGFHDQHLAWLSRFAACLAAHARHDFYRALAEAIPLATPRPGPLRPTRAGSSPPQA